MSFKILFVIPILLLSGCAASQKRYWYEHPGIVLGGIGYGALLGPENVSIREAHRRAVKKGRIKWGDEFIPYYVLGSILHLGTAIPLLILAPPFGIGYMGLSSLVGAAQFYQGDAWDGSAP